MGLWKITFLIKVFDGFETRQTLIFLQTTRKKIGHILEVDIKIPTHLHDYFADHPPLLTHEDFGSGPKLVGTLFPKKKYVIHMEMLKFVTQLGVVVTKIHRVLRFYQTPILKKYMQLNMRLRMKAKDEFTKTQRKFMNNSTIGKSLQNDRNHEDIRITTSWKQAERLIAKNTFQRATVFSENLAAIHMKKTSTTLKQPIYLGFTVLELAKREVWDFHYNFIKPNVKAHLCYTGKVSKKKRKKNHSQYKFVLQFQTQTVSFTKSSIQTYMNSSRKIFLTSTRAIFKRTTHTKCLSSIRKSYYS